MHRFLAWFVSLALVVGTPLAVFGHGTFEARLASATRRIAAEPGAAQGYIVRAGIYHSHGDWDEALADLDRALRRDTARTDVHLHRGRTLRAAGRHSEAETALGRLLAVEPAHAGARAERGRVRAAQGRWLEAASDFAAAIERSPRPLPDDYLERAAALAAAGQRDNAIHVLDQGLARLGALPALGDAAIALEIEAARFDAALARLDRFAADAPRSAPWLARRADLLERMGRHREASESARLALSQIARLPGPRRMAPALKQDEARLRAQIVRLEAREK